MSVPPPVRMNEETLARQVERLMGWMAHAGQWPTRTFADKIEPIEDET